MSSCLFEMAVNASSPAYRVWICSVIGYEDGTPIYASEEEGAEHPAFEVTRYCSGSSSGYLSVSSGAIDTNGIIPFSGQLTLDVPPDEPIFDPWENPGLWAIGNVVLFKVADRNGTLRVPPLGRLYIISEPKPPYPGHWQLEIELGDKLTLGDSNKPDPRGLGFTSKERTQIISALVGAAGGNLTGSVTGGSLGSFQVGFDSSAAQQAGELTFAGGSALYQSSGGDITTCRLYFKPEYRLFKHVIGRDDAGDFEPLQNPLRPAGEVNVITTETAVDDSPDDGIGLGGGGNNRNRNEDRQKYNGSLKTTETMSKGSIVEGESEQEITAVVREESWQWGGAIFTQQVEEQRARGLVVPEDLFDYLIQQGRSITVMSPFNRIYALTCTETRTYEGSSEGRLLTIRKESYKCLGEVLCEFYKKTLLPNSTIPNFFSKVLAELEITTFSYKKFEADNNGEDAKGQVRRIKTVRYQLTGQIAGAATDWIDSGGLGGATVKSGSTDLTPVEVTIETWAKRSKDEWEHKVQHYQAGRARNGTIKAFTRLLKTDRSITEVARNGNIRPPAAERRPANQGQQGSNSIARLTTPRIGTVKVSGNNSGRSRSLVVQNTVDKEDNERIAAIVAQLDEYRHHGFRITTAWRDEWFSWSPLARIDIEYKGYIYTGLTDAVTMTFASNQAVVVADCMKTGRQPNPASEDSYPHTPLPALQPDDPDPEPFPQPPLDELYPDRLNHQPFVPAVSLIHLLQPVSRSRVIIRQLDAPVVPLPVTDMSVVSRSRVRILEYVPIRSRSRVVISEAVPIRSRSRVIIEPLPEVRVISRSIVAVSDAAPIDTTLVADWDMSNEGWVDSVAGLNLAKESSTAYPIVTSGYTEFIEGDVSNLKVSGEPLPFTIYEDGKFWSWKIEFELSMADPGYGFFFYMLVLDGQIGLAMDAYEATEPGTAPLSFALQGGSYEEVTVNFPLDADWHTVAFGYDYPTETIFITLDGETTSLILSERPSLGENPYNFYFGTTVEARFRNQLKFYKYALEP